MDSSFLEIIAIVILVAANGFFALSEFAIIASRRSKLKQLARRNYRHAALAAKMQSHPENFLATIQMGITFVGVLAGVFGGMTIVESLTPQLAGMGLGPRYAQTVSFVLVVVGIGVLSVVMGELVPKHLALSSPERIAATVARPISLFSSLTYFAVKMLTGFTRLILRMLGFKHLPERSVIAEDEINLIIAEGREKGVFDATEQEIIHSVFDFSDTTARQAMTPRTDIVGLDINDATDAILKKMSEEGFSRYPVYDGDLDNIVGILYTKDTINILRGTRHLAFHEIIRKPFFIPDSMKLNHLLKTFQQKKVHVAIVLDEFGGTAGLITLEDLLEEIVGEIQDEYDTDKREFVKESDTVAFASASYGVDDLNHTFKTTLPEDGPDTIGGMVFTNMGRIASKGEEVVIDNLRITILEVDGNRMKRFRLEKLIPPGAGA